MESRAAMTVGRPQLVETIVAWSGLSYPHVEASTRYQMEADQLPNIKGRRTPARASYQPRDAAAGLLGLAAKRASGAPEAHTKLAFLQAEKASGGVVLDPVGRLLPPLEAPTFDENETSRIELLTFAALLLGSVSRLAIEEAAALSQTPGARSACLELNVDTATAIFRWVADGKEHWVRFEHPGGTFTEALGREPPAFQTVTKLYFPLLFAVGRLFAATSKHGNADPVPPPGEAPASADPEAGNENAEVPARTSAPARKRNRPRHNATGAVSSPETRGSGGKSSTPFVATAGHLHEKDDDA